MSGCSDRVEERRGGNGSSGRGWEECASELGWTKPAWLVFPLQRQSLCVCVFNSRMAPCSHIPDFYSRRLHWMNAF